MKCRIFRFLVAFSLLLPLSALAGTGQRGLTLSPGPDVWGKYHALIVGINDYVEWPHLKTAVKDATALKEVLVSRYGFDEKDVILRTDRSASRLQILRDLRHLAQSMKNNDNLFVYFAGHGQMDEFTGDGYWVPAEGKLKDPGTWVANSYIKAVLSSERLQAKNVVVIADSCYSGSMLRGGPSLMSLDDGRYREKLAEKASLPSRQVISSGGVEPVADGGVDGHSLFAYYLIKALKENNREVIDLENLFHTRVWKPVTEIGDQRPNVGRLKTPMDQDGQFVLYNVAMVRAQSKATPRQAAPPMPDKSVIAGTATRMAPQNFNAEEEMWAFVKTSSVIEDYEFFLEEYPHSRFEGAARLKIQQLKRKQSARSMATAVAPVAKPPGTTSGENPAMAGKKSGRNPTGTEPVGSPKLAAIDRNTTHLRHPSRERYRLALLPIHCASVWSTRPKGKERAAIGGIFRESENDARLELAYAYMKPEDASEAVALLGDTFTEEDLEVWKRESVFAKIEPDWEKVKRIGSRIDADFVVLARIYIDTVSSGDLYLYDCKTGKLASKIHRPIYSYTVGAGTQQMLRDSFAGFFETQKE